MKYGCRTRTLSSRGWTTLMASFLRRVLTASEASYWKRRPSDPRHLLGRLKNQIPLRLDLKGKEDRVSPVFIPSIWSICDSHEHSHCSTSEEAGPAPWGTLVKTPSSKRVSPREQSIRCGSHSKMRAVDPLESRLCMLQSQSDHAQTVCIPLVI